MEELCKERTSTVNSPTLELSAMAQLPENTHCVVCSEDGCYLCVGHSHGLMVFSTSSSDAVAEWKQDRLDICSVQMTAVAVAERTYYLLGAVDDMGVARLFALYSEAIHLLCVLNIMEEINKRSICLSLDILEGGQCGAALFSCQGTSWLEIFHFPLESWQKDLEMRQSPKQESLENMKVKGSPVSSLMKIQPLKMNEGPSTEGKHLDGPLDQLQPCDLSAHWLALDVIRSSSYQQETLSHSSAQGTKETSKSTRCCTQHFLLSCSHFTVDCKSGLPVAIGLWWSGSHNFLQYLLQKAPNKKQNAEPMPDVVWPNQYPILCSAVSTCTRYVALGLGEASVCVWDRKLGAPVSILVVPDVSSAFFGIQFVDHCQKTADFFQSMSAQDSVLLTVLCKSGAIHTISTGRGIKPRTVQLDKRLKHSRDIPVTMTSVPFLEGLIFVVQMTGKMFLQDVINRKMVCVMTPPPTHAITTSCNPVYALSNKQQTLFIRGDQRITGSGSSESRSHLFVLRFGENDIIKQYIGCCSK
ncbi:WD repeat-containing protein 93 isoform X2 [Gouania willdenowi]|uniref:WD repeat domain 93 n=1 Tax=Gouania willdenowi TaxID=441366 RepID=A0A8C5I6W6_GOUWI|nr:WD repeat-containing protein 93 isoform X2 [Gouania willdenowi]